MIDDILEVALPWGLFAALGALVGSAFPRETRNATKAVVRTALRAGDWAREVGAVAYEKGQDVIAEARSEYEHLTREAERESNRARLRVVESTPTPRRRRTTSPRRTSRTRRTSGTTASSQ
jgi:hypothetical protein